MYYGANFNNVNRIHGVDLFEENPKSYLVKVTEKTGSIGGFWSDPRSDFLLYLMKNPTDGNLAYAINITEGYSSEEYPTGSTLVDSWGTFGPLDAESPEVLSIFGFSKQELMLFTFNNSMYCGSDFLLGDCAICRKFSDRKGECLFCRESFTEDKTKCTGVDPDKPPEKRCNSYSDYPHCFKKMHKPFKYFAIFSPGRKFQTKPHFQVYFKDTKVYSALKEDQQLDLIKITVNKNVDSRRRRILQDECSDIKSYPFVYSTYLAIFIKASNKCLDYFHNTRYLRNFTIDFGVRGETQYLAYDPPSLTLTLNPTQLKLFAINSRSLADMPNKPSFLQVIKPQNLMNFGTQGLSNKTKLLQESGKFAQGAGYVITPVFGVSILSLTLMMSFLMRLVQKFENFNVNYGKIMKYLLEMGFKEKLVKLRPKLSEKSWNNYMNSNYRPLLTPFSHSFYSIQVDISKYIFIGVLFIMRLARGYLLTRFAKWRKRYGDEYFYRNEDDEFDESK